MEAARGAGRPAISTRLDGARRHVLIESSEPVAYVTSQPDPLTVLVDLRNVKAGVLPPGLGPLPPVTDVRVEEAMAGDGAEVARVRVTLAYAAKHRVQKLAQRDLCRGRPRQSSRIRRRSLAKASNCAKRARRQRRGSGHALKSVRAIDNGIAIEADGRLVASAVEEAKDQPPRLLLDFPGVSARGVPAVTDIKRGAVERVRVGANGATPVVTRVVIDLVKRAPFRVEEKDNELHILFDAGDTVHRARGTGGARDASAAPVPPPTPAPVTRAPDAPVPPMVLAAAPAAAAGAAPTARRSVRRAVAGDAGRNRPVPGRSRHA